MMNAILVLTTLPDAQSAQAMAQRLIELRLAACVNILAPCSSMYHWRGKLETASEVPLLIKAPEANYDALEQAIRESHPYELPEIIAVPVVHGSAEYLHWVGDVSLSPS